MKIWRAKRCPPKIYKHFFVEPDKLNAIRETAMDDKHCYRSSPDMANAKKSPNVLFSINIDYIIPFLTVLNMLLSTQIKL